MSDVTHKPDDTYFNELMGAAAFGHLDAHEQVAFDEWLSDHHEGQLEYAELVAAVHLLPLSLDEIAPSDGLRSRIAAAIDARQGASSPDYGDQSAAPVSIEQARGRRQGFFFSSAGRMIAAAAVLVVVMIGSFAVFDSISSDTIESIAIAEAPEGFDGSLDYNVDASELQFSVDTMPPAPEGQVYQAWLIRDGQPESAGVMTGTEMEVSANRSDYEAFAITVEPGPNGSTAPTSDPVLVASLANGEEGADV